MSAFKAWKDSITASLKEFKGLPGYLSQVSADVGKAGAAISRSADGIVQAVVGGLKEGLMIKEEPVIINGPQIGDKTADGWFYVGISATTGAAIYAAPVIEQLNGAEAGVAAQAKNARVPSRGELRQLFEAQSVIGTLPYKAFEEKPVSATVAQIPTQNDNPAWFLSSEESVRKVVVKNLVTGEEGAVRKDYGRHSVWLVRN